MNRPQYINEEDSLRLTAELTAWKEEVILKAKELRCTVKQLDENTLPPVNDFIGSSILLIAQKIAAKHSFNRYSYIDEMISDGVLQALRMIKNFNPDIVMRNGKPASAFNLISMIIEQTFIRRIKSEKHQQNIKCKALIEHSLDDLIAEAQHIDFDINIHEQPTEYLQTIYNDHLRRFQEYEIELGNNRSNNQKNKHSKKHKKLKSMF